jgi:hypothetical protein
MISGDEARLGGEQFSEYMLCSLCEERFNAWETYIAGIALQTNDRFPALDAVKILDDSSSEEVVMADASMLNVGAITRFAVSVIWRASASRRWFPTLSLGDRYQRELARYLLDDAASLPSWARLSVDLMRSAPGTGGRVDHVVIAPYPYNAGGFHMHRFAMFGMVFCLAIGRLVPQLLDEMCIATSRRVRLSDDGHIRQILADKIPKLRKHPSLQRWQERRKR